MAFQNCARTDFSDDFAPTNAVTGPTNTDSPLQVQESSFCLDDETGIEYAIGQEFNAAIPLAEPFELFKCDGFDGRVLHGPGVVQAKKVCTTGGELVVEPLDWNSHLEECSIAEYQSKYLSDNNGWNCDSDDDDCDDD